MRVWLLDAGLEAIQVDGAVENLYNNLDHDKNDVITENELPSHDEL